MIPFQVITDNIVSVLRRRKTKQTKQRAVA